MDLPESGRPVPEPSDDPVDRDGGDDRPLVSVLVACFEHEDHLERALDSVAAQTYDRLEVVIVDDCSTDRSVERIEQWLRRTGFPARFVANGSNTGICAVLNSLLAMSTGDWCVLLDTDDWFEPDRIERHVDHIAGVDPDVAVVFGDATMADESGASTGQSFLELHLDGRPVPDDADVFDALLVGNFLPTCAVTVRRSAIASVGGYDEGLAYDDYDMWLRLGARHRFSRCDGRVANYRTVATSMAHDPAWRPPIAESTIRILVGWAGTDAVRSVPSRRVAVSAQLRRDAIVAAAAHPDAARAALATAEQLDPSPWWRGVARARVLSWPGGPQLVHDSRRVAHAARRRWRRAVR